MRGAATLIPARFLSLLAHLCVLVTLLWETPQSIRHCLPSEFQDTHYTRYQSRMITGYGVSIALTLLELLTFVTGLTMFSPSVSVTSIGCHGFGAIALTYFIVDSWLCDTFWIIFFFCTVIPSLLDASVAAFTLCYNKW